MSSAPSRDPAQTATMTKDLMDKISPALAGAIHALYAPIKDVDPTWSPTGDPDKDEDEKTQTRTQKALAHVATIGSNLTLLLSLSFNRGLKKEWNAHLPEAIATVVQSSVPIVLNSLNFIVHIAAGNKP